MRWKVLTLVLALAGALIGLGAPGVPEAAACEEHQPECSGGGAAETALTIQGTLIAGAAVTVQARAQGDQVSGTVSIPTSVFLTGPIIEIVPPEGARDYYCVIAAGRPSVPGERAVVLFRDKGDGITTFDDLFATEGVPASGPYTCGDFTSTPDILGPATAGNFAVTR